METFSRRSSLACSAAELFQWHVRPEAFTELQPPWEKVRQLSPAEPLHESQIVSISIRLGFLSLPWVSEITSVIDAEEFTDVQRRGPFAFWEHRHRFIAVDCANCMLDDSIRYLLPLHAISNPLAGGMVRKRLNRMFEYRHNRMIRIFGSASLHN